MFRRINSTLMHLRNVTDFYTVVDTASEDNTVEVVRELMSGVPGQIIQHGPLKSFADARNHAFKVALLLYLLCTSEVVTRLCKLLQDEQCPSLLPACTAHTDASECQAKHSGR